MLCTKLTRNIPKSFTCPLLYHVYKIKIVSYIDVSKKVYHRLAITYETCPGCWKQQCDQWTVKRVLWPTMRIETMISSNNGHCVTHGEATHSGNSWLVYQMKGQGSWLGVGATVRHVFQCVQEHALLLQVLLILK